MSYRIRTKPCRAFSPRRRLAHHRKCKTRIKCQTATNSSNLNQLEISRITILTQKTRFQAKKSKSSKRREISRWPISRRFKQVRSRLRPARRLYNSIFISRTQKTLFSKCLSKERGRVVLHQATSLRHRRKKARPGVQARRLSRDSKLWPWILS